MQHHQPPTIAILGANTVVGRALCALLEEGVREAFVGAIGKSAPQRASVPVIALSTTVEEDLPENEGVISVPWPCETKVLVEQIEAALLDVPPASTAASTGDPAWPS